MWLLGFADLLVNRPLLLAVVLSVVLGEVVFNSRARGAFSSHSRRQWVQLYLLEVVWYVFSIAGWTTIMPERHLPVQAAAALAILIPTLTLPARFALSDRNAKESAPSITSDQETV